VRGGGLDLGVEGLYTSTRKWFQREGKRRRRKTVGHLRAHLPLLLLLLSSLSSSSLQHHHHPLLQPRLLPNNRFPLLRQNLPRCRSSYDPSPPSSRVQPQTSPCSDPESGRSDDRTNEIGRTGGEEGRDEVTTTEEEVDEGCESPGEEEDA